MELLLSSGIQEDVFFAEQVAKIAGLELRLASNTDEVLQRVSNSAVPFLLLFGVADAQQAEEFYTKIGPKIGTSQGKIHPDLVHMIGVLDPEEVTEYFKKSLCGSFLLRNYGDPAEAANHYGRLLPEMLSRRGIQGLRRFDSDKAEKIVMTHSKEKSSVIEKITKFLLEEGKFQERMVTTICTAVDELLMNAIYDAPTDDSGLQSFKNSPRTAPIELTGRHSLEILVSVHGEYASVSVVDHFGSLKRSNIIKHVFKSYQSADYQVDHSVFNAGIGLATTFQMGGSLLFFCDSNERTEATVLFKRTESFKKFRSQFRFVSVQSDQE